MADGFASQLQSQSYSQSAQRRVHRPRCPQCGSRRFRRDPNTLLVVCALGHVLQGYREEQAEDGDEFEASQGSQRRRRRLHKDPSERGRKRYRNTLTTGVWYGERSRALYFRCLQLLLRMQLQAIRRELEGIPLELETVCRELWALYVTLQPDLTLQTAEEELPEAGSGSSTPVPPASSRAASGQKAELAERQALLEEADNESDRFDEELRSMGLSGGDDDDGDDMRSRWTGSDTDINTEDEADSNDEVHGARKSTRKQSQRRQASRSGTSSTFSYRLKNSDSHRGRKPLTTLLAIIYLALITLHVPVLWSDVQALVLSERLPFLHAVYRLPSEMTRPLNYRQMAKLDGQIVPSLAQLQRRVVELGRDLSEAFGARFPELNSLPLLVRCSESMLLPPTVYRAAKRMLAYADVPMHPVLTESAASVPPTQADEDSRDIPSAGARRRGSRRRVRSPDDSFKAPQLDKRLSVSLSKRSVARDVILMAAVVMMAKMRYGLDGEERFECPSDVGVWTGAPTMQAWLAALDAHEQRSQTQIDCTSNPHSIEVLDMDEHQLDAYIDYAERHLILRHHPNALLWRSRDDTDDMLKCGPDDMTDSYAADEDEMKLWQVARETLNASLEALYKAADDAPDTIDGNGNGRVPTSRDLRVGQLRPGEAHIVYQRVPSHEISEDESKSRLLDNSPSSDKLVHWTYACVLRHGSRVVGCTTDVLADTVYALEVRLIKMILYRRAQRQALADEEDKQRK